MKRITRHKARLSILATASAVGFLAMASSSMALMPPTMNFGLLQPQDQWKVGTVNTDGLSYCAMVNKFEKRVVLAFARSAQGYGSLAIDFRESFFEPGAQYDVSLTLGAGKAQKFSGRASSDRSVVVQIGQDHQFFEKLSGDGNLELSMPTIEASFALRKFANSYKNLDDCAAKIAAANPPAVKVKDVEQTALAPIDEEVQKLSEERAQLASARAEVEQMRQNLQNKSVSIEEMEARLKREAVEREAQSAKTVADLDAQKKDLTEQMVAQVNTAQAEASKPGRKLLASTSDSTLDSIAPAASGMEAKLMEQDQILKKTDLRVQEDMKKSQALEQAMAEKQKEIADLQFAQAQEKDKQTSDFKKKDAELVARLNEMQQERESLEKKLQAERLEKEKALAAVQSQDADRQQQEASIKASLVSTQAQIADLSQKRQAETVALNQKLATTEAEHQKKIADLQAAHQTQVASLEERLKGVEAQRQAEIDLASKAKTDLAQTQQQLEDVKKGLSSDQQRLTDLQASLNAQKADLDKRAADLGSREAVVTQKEQDLQTKEKELLAAKEKSSLDNISATSLSDQLAAQSKELETARGRIQQLEEQNKQAQARIAELQDALASKQTISDAGKGFMPMPPVESVAVTEPITDANHSLQDIGPASGEAVVAEAKPPAKKDYFPSLPSMKIIWDDLGYSRKAPVEKKLENSSEMPAVPNEPVVSQELASADMSSNGNLRPNKAAAFLDRIMGYHHGTTTESTPMKKMVDDDVAKKQPKISGQQAMTQEAPVASPASMAEAPKVPVAAEQPMPPLAEKEMTPTQKEPVVQADKAVSEKGTEPVKEIAAVPQNIPAKENPPIVSAPVVSATEDVRSVDTEALTRPPFLSQGSVSVPPKMHDERIEAKAPQTSEPVAEPELTATAATPAVSTEIKQEPVSQISKAESVAPVQPPVSEAIQVQVSEALSIEDLLMKAGFSGVEYTPVITSPGETAKQWSFNGINGMFEQMASSGGNFDAQVQTYLDRYREDCPGHLQVDSLPAQVNGDLRAVNTHIECTMSGNSYASSFVFAQDAVSFSTIMHSAVLGQKADIKKLMNDISQALLATKGLKVQYAPVPSYPATADRGIRAPEVAAAPIPAENEAQPQPVQLRFNIKEGAAEKPAVETVIDNASSDDGFQTIVIQ